ncbi:flavin reductase like domain-containing protein [Chaetomium strumarium]|uniref:Flavin reductase like domain-containing protein n=1 Tax=Chaetomium strumarium TaxID=1170767 RepID=A0AAJ0GY54_9PEZI|nr:flavin reductase like domain-containing protein [Chaetomium strumarium]
MSSRRVLVGSADEFALVSRQRPRRNYAPRSDLAVMRLRTSVAQFALPSGRICYPKSSSLPIRPLHTTRQTSRTSLSDDERESDRRRPRTFAISPPQPPSIHPPRSSKTQGTTSSTTPTPLHLHLTRCPPGSPSIPRAMTMSSLTSLALSPTPVVTFNIAVPSRTFDAIAASRRFNIHVLADNAAGASVADWLAGGNTGGREVLERLSADGGVEVEPGEQEGDAPVLKGDGVLYVLRCRLLEDANAPTGGFVRVRDHVIVLGEVLEIVERSGSQREVKDRFGLLYADRRYRQLGKCITPVEKEEEGRLLDDE